MGAQQRVYKQRIRSAQGMKKIFKAKEMVAASRIAKAHARVEATTPYAEALTRAGLQVERIEVTGRSRTRSWTRTVSSPAAPAS